MQRVVIGTRALQDPAWVREMAFSYPGRVVLGLDARDGLVATHGWENLSDQTVFDLARLFANWPDPLRPTTKPGRRLWWKSMQAERTIGACSAAKN